ncbi:MAG: DUF4185 domain-containing protein [Bryobacteraceae bacterium]
MGNSPRSSVWALLFLSGIVQPPPAAAQSAGATSLTYVAGSSVKLEQIVGDQDYQTKAPTASQTVSRFNILGNDIGYSFEDNGKAIFLFGDTIGRNVNYRAHDPLAWSASTNPEAGLALNFFTNSDGTPLFVEPPGIDMGPDDVPNSGISLASGIYLICNTGADTSLANPHVNDSSVLARFDETAQTFTTGRTISHMPGGHFIITAPHISGTEILLFGAGAYRASDIYLSTTPASSFATGAGTRYFAGLVDGQPMWTSAEAGAVPVVVDNPLNGPVWPNHKPTVGNLSVIFSSDLGLWLMTYDGGRQSEKTTGAYFTYAQQPWGPWATPQLIFNGVRDNGLGAFIHNPAILPDPPGDGLNGPTIGSNDIYTTRGGAYAPLMIERFTRVAGNTLKIYYTMSTWNPYTVVKMRSEFTISGAVPAISLVANAEGDVPTIAPNTWVEIKGTNIAPASDTRIWQSSDFVSNQLPTELDGVGVTVNGKSAYVYYISPTQVNILTPPDAMQGPVQVRLTNAGVTSAPATVQAQPVSPSFFIFNGGAYVAAEHASGALLGPASLFPGLTSPAKPGETAVLYANGFGSTAQGGTLSPPPVVKIGGVTATVTFAGLVAPGQFQFNVVVPASLADGDQPIAATYNGSETQAGVLLTVQH